MNDKQLARFWAKVDKSGDCWNWIGAKHGDGYGLVTVEYKKWRAHRLSYLMANGNLPADAVVMHRCDNPSCVNPRHLVLGTQLDNMLDMQAKGRDNYVGRPRKRR